MSRSRRNSIVQDFLVPLQSNQESEDVTNLQNQFSKRLSILGSELEASGSGGKLGGGRSENMKSHAALQQLFLSSENRPRQWQPDEDIIDQDEVAISGAPIALHLLS